MEYNDDGLTALIFTAEGDMRQAINNLQSTHSGFGFISGDNVFKVCDQPHPIIVQTMIRACLKSDIDTALEKLHELWNQGYSAVDIVVTLFRVAKTFDEYVNEFIVLGLTLIIGVAQHARIHKTGVHQGQLLYHHPLTFRNIKSISPIGNRLYAHADIGGCGYTDTVSGACCAAM